MIIEPLIRSHLHIKERDISRFCKNRADMDNLCHHKLMNNIMRRLNEMRDARPNSEGLKVNLELMEMSAISDPARLAIEYSLSAMCFIEDQTHARVGECVKFIHMDFDNVWAPVNGPCGVYWIKRL